MGSTEANFIRYSPQPNRPSLPTSIPDPYRIGAWLDSITAARDPLVHHTVAGPDTETFRVQPHEY